METNYRWLDEYPRKIFLTSLMIIGITYPATVIALMLHEDSKLVVILFTILNAIVFAMNGTVAANQNIRINESRRTIYATSPFSKTPVESQTFIDGITTIEVFRSKKGKIKKLLLRSGEIRFFRVQTARNQEVLNHLLRLKADIPVIEKNYGINSF